MKMLARSTIILYFATLIYCSPIDNAKPPMASYQSPDGSIRLTIHQTDNQFILRNGTEEVGLIKVEPVTESTTENDYHAEVKTAKSEILKATSTEVAKGVTEATTSSVSSTEAISRMTAIPAGGSKLTSVAVVTPSEAIQTTTTAATTTTTLAAVTTEDNKSIETEEINDKIKEVEAIPVILAVRV